MRQLLENVRQILTGVEGVRDMDVFLTPEAAYLLPAAALPALGVHDGGFRQTEAAGGVLRRQATVEVACWVRGDRPELAVASDSGVLALAEAVSALLLAEAHFPADCQWVQLPTQSPSVSLRDSGGGWVQLVTLNFMYDQEVERP